MRKKICVWLLSLHVITAATEEMERLHQIRNSAGASAFAPHDHRQEAKTSPPCFELALMI